MMAKEDHQNERLTEPENERPNRNFTMEIGTEFGIDTDLKNRAASLFEDKFIRGFAAGAASAILAGSIVAFLLYLLYR